MSRLVDIVKGLLEDASLYLDLFWAHSGNIRACIELVDTMEAATLKLGEEPEVVEGSVNPDFKISMNSQTLGKILKEQADAFALAGRARSDEVRPIEFEVYDKNRDEEIWETIKSMLTYLFILEK
jgi:hypothetical protein